VAAAGAEIAKSNLVREALIVVAVTAIGAFLVYHFFVHTIRNQRPLAGGNVAIAMGKGTQSEPSFAVDPINRYADAGTGLTLRCVQHVCRKPPHWSSLERNRILPSAGDIVNNFFICVNTCGEPFLPAATLAALNAVRGERRAAWPGRRTVSTKRRVGARSAALAFGSPIC